MTEKYINIPSDESIGSTNEEAPLYATLIGGVDASGKLQPALIDTLGNLKTSGTATVTGNVNANINGLNSFDTPQFTVGTTAVQITLLTGQSSMTLKAICSGQNSIWIANNNGVTAGVGGGGYPMFNGDVTNMDVTNSPSVWAIATAAAQTICTIRLA